MRKFWDEKMETMPHDKLQHVQLDHLRATLALVYEQVPFYKKSFDEHGVKPGDLKRLEDLAKFPFTIKNDLRDNYPYGLCAVPRCELVRIHASSGTTGKPITGLYTEDDRAQWGECMARAMWAQSVRPDDLAQNAYGMGLFTGGLGFLLGFERIGCTVVPSGAGMTERQIMLMEDLGSTVLASTPTYALTIAERARMIGKDMTKFPLRVGCFGAEPWSVEMKGLIEERMGIIAHEHYGLTELMGPGVSFSCEAGTLHINEDHAYPEIVHPDTGEVLPLGERGELIFTSLQRQAMPMIRYRTRDISRLYREECPCGRTFVAMEKVTGRTDDMMIVSGVNLFPSQIESVLMEFEEVEPLYQIHLYRQGFIDRVRVDAEASPDAQAKGAKYLLALADKISYRLHELIGITIPVSFVATGTIPRSEGKAKRVIDERAGIR